MRISDEIFCLNNQFFYFLLYRLYVCGKHFTRCEPTGTQGAPASGGSRLGPGGTAPTFCLGQFFHRLLIIAMDDTMFSWRSEPPPQIFLARTATGTCMVPALPQIVIIFLNFTIFYGSVLLL